MRRNAQNGPVKRDQSFSRILQQMVVAIQIMDEAALSAVRLGATKAGMRIKNRKQG